MSGINLPLYDTNKLSHGHDEEDDDEEEEMITLN
jgi:hypothetical protein